MCGCGAGALAGGGAAEGFAGAAALSSVQRSPTPQRLKRLEDRR